MREKQIWAGSDLHKHEQPVDTAKINTILEQLERRLEEGETSVEGENVAAMAERMRALSGSSSMGRDLIGLLNQKLKKFGFKEEELL